MGDTGRTISLLHSHPGDGPAPGRQPTGENSGSGPRPWIGVRFLCAGAYLRVPRNREGTAYHAVCPRCGKRVRFRVGPGGTSQRFFEVSC